MFAFVRYLNICSKEKHNYSNPTNMFMQYYIERTSCNSCYEFCKEKQPLVARSVLLAITILHECILFYSVLNYTSKLKLLLVQNTKKLMDIIVHKFNKKNGSLTAYLYV